MSHVSYASGFDQFLYVLDFALQNMSSNVWLEAVDDGIADRRRIHIGQTFGNFGNASYEVVDGLVSCCPSDQSELASCQRVALDLPKRSRKARLKLVHDSSCVGVRVS